MARCLSVCLSVTSRSSLETDVDQAVFTAQRLPSAYLHNVKTSYSYIHVSDGRLMYPIAATNNRSTVFARWRQCARPLDSHAPQTAARSGHVHVCAGLMTHSPYTLHCAVPFPPNFAPSRGGAGSPSNTSFLWPTRPTTPNDIPIKSAVFPQYTLVTTDRTNTEIDLHQQAACATSYRATRRNNNDAKLRNGENGKKIRRLRDNL